MDHGSMDERSRFVELGIDGCEQAVEVGRGGFSVVYRAWQPAFSRHVAIKVLSAAPDPTEVDRFSRECAAIGSLQGHPNIVTVHGAGRLPGGQPYIVMEFLSEGSLAERIARQPLGWVAAVDIGIKLAGALESAHQAGVLHRDVKPANVMLSRFGECKLGDFGIARMEGRMETRSAAVTASWSHAPPEVVNGMRPTKASDVYSLASTLYMLMDGLPAFVRDSDESLLPLLARIVRDPVRPMRTIVPPEVERVLRQGMAKDPGTRQSSAAELGRQLQSAQSASNVAVTALPLAVDGAAEPLTEVGPAETEPVDPRSLEPTQDASRRSGDRPPTPGPRSPGGRRAGVAVALAAAVVLALVAWALTRSDSGPSKNTASGTTIAPATTASGPSSTSSPATTTGPGTTTAPPPTTVAPGPGVRLGQGLVPASAEPCRTPNTASGAAWQLAPVQLGGRPFDVAYYCNLFAGGTGSLDFVLGGSYKTLTTSIGFADGSPSTGHMVKFEFIGDGRVNLIDPRTIRFGDVVPLQIDVSGVTRLQIRVTELSPPGGSEGASKPVLATPTLTKA
jgi:serine/threonine protein kinase